MGKVLIFPCRGSQQQIFMKNVDMDLELSTEHHLKLWITPKGHENV